MTGNFLYDWQTLISAALALCVALPTIYLLWHQIQDVRSIEEKRRQSMLIGVRSRLPLSLSTICRYCTAIKKDITDEIAGKGESASLYDAIDELSALIQYSDSGNVIGIASEIISEIQVIEARRSDEACMNPMMKSAITFQLARLYALSISLFPYARGEVEDASCSVSWEEFQSAISSMMIRVEHSEHLSSLLGKKEGRPVFVNDRP